MKDVIQTLPRTRFVWTRTSCSTTFWWTVFLLFEWIHPSIDQQCSYTDAEHMTPETLYTNQTSFLNMVRPVFLSVTPLTMFLSKLLEKASSFRGWKDHEHHPSPRHQNDTVKRDSIYCNSENIIDCKTRFDFFGRILGAGVPFAYVSNVKANSGSLRNLPSK